jgi:hypothetical protein
MIIPDFTNKMCFIACDEETIKSGRCSCIKHFFPKDEIIKLEKFIQEEERCLEYCLNNPEDSSEQEINDLKNNLDKLYVQLQELKKNEK